MKYSILILVAVLVAWMAISKVAKLHVEVDFQSNSAQAQQLQAIE